MSADCEHADCLPADGDCDGLAAPRPLRASHSENAPLIVAPRGIVILLSALAAIMFLVEGAILDWSALLVLEKRLVTEAQGGLGYAIFAIAMTAGRFGGDSSRRGSATARRCSGAASRRSAGFALLLLRRSRRSR